MTNRKPVLGMLAAAIILGLAAGTAGAATIHVRNNGVDTATCGAVPTPCRSISQAIAHAAAKDRILVGPGRYGDLNGNGILGEPGEEPGPVFVSKQLTLESEEGAGATIIDMSGLHIDVLRITAGGAGSVIGLPARGFVLSGGGWGLSTENPFPGQLTIAGNIAINNIENGFLLHEQSTYVLDNNLAIRNGTTGFLVHGGSNHKIRGNAAVANGIDGFSGDGGSWLEVSGNLAIGNAARGFAKFQNVVTTFRGNSALGNKSFGISLMGTTATATQNNIFGNDPLTNCGLKIEDAEVNAVNNFFGAATGPGPDPADDICIGFASATYIPFATQGFPVSTNWK